MAKNNSENNNATDNKPYIRAFHCILSHQDITFAEKIILIEICRYYPACYYGTNKQIAQNIGSSDRYTEKLINGLKKKNIIRAGYTNKKIIQKSGSFRVLLCTLLDGWKAKHDKEELQKNYFNHPNNRCNDKHDHPNNSTVVSKPENHPNYSADDETNHPNRLTQSSEPECGRSSEPECDQINNIINNKLLHPPAPAPGATAGVFRNKLTTKNRSRKIKPNTMKKDKTNPVIEPKIRSKKDSEKLKRVEDNKRRLLKQAKNIQKTEQDEK